MNRLDLFLIALALLVAWTGYRRGAVVQFLSYGGLAAGLVAGALAAPRLAPLADNPLDQVGVALASIVVGGVLGNVVGRLIGGRVRAAARKSHLGPVDSTLGAAVAVIVLGLVAWFITYNLVNGPFPGVAKVIRESAVVKGLDAVLPQPPAFFGEVRDFFNRFGFPQVFAGLPPAPAGPVTPPTQEEATTAFDAAAGSTVRVVGHACDQLQEGSGFVVASNYILTNAHVVAGVRAPQAQQQNGESQAATTVLFDPQLDIAVLRVAATPGPVLSLAGEDAPRGAVGATVGYPGGGDLGGVKAAVREVIQAKGRDIYGRKPVTREVYELQTDVQPGDSGGPFVLTDGTVAGVVFAASTTDKDLGYAITSTELDHDLQRAVSSVTPVSTGACVR